MPDSNFHYQLPLTAATAIPVTIVLRDYQEAAVAAIRKVMGQFKRLCFVMPTGAGKTIVFSYISRAAAAKGNTVMIVAHRRRICIQISRALTAMGVQHGMIMPGQPMTADAVQVGMIQTVAKRIHLLVEPALMVIDECHHAPAGTWEKVCDQWRDAHKLGVTATPERLDGKGLRGTFDALVQGPTMAELIEAGALSDYTYLAPPSDLDLSRVHSRGGDYATDELEAAMGASSILGDAVEHYGTYLDGKPAVAFCVTVAHAEATAAAFQAAGWNAASIDGKMTPAEQEDLLERLGDGRLNVLCSCELISEGVDIPNVGGVILLRPTKSLALWLQQVGRGLRPNRDGSKSVILDHVGSVHRFGMPDFPRSWSLDGRKKKAKAPDIRVCKLCFRTLPAIVTRGPSWDCGGVDNEACPFTLENEATMRALPEAVAGELAEVQHVAPEGMDVTRPPWACGIALETARGREWFRLLDCAGTDLERLEQIREARGFKKGWPRFALANRHRINREVEDAIHGELDVQDMSTDALYPLIHEIIAIDGDGDPAQVGESNSEWIRQIRAEFNNRKMRAA